ncbi:helix-turn-helix domain-containing protein [Bradyrhizobium sp. Tv2a-2]|uniref:winged helix-turn-helix transcriptional regulator n=1 Tax=Bradyrhizobium sp. Tv2a-2 TaxID=113395 RepID=UPI000466736D|nr:helix-turn-helix domain-containing protein [Bradyrhizobium sp. Tv2a-2]
MSDNKLKASDRRIEHVLDMTLDLICGKWKAAIIYQLLTGAVRFSELKRRLSKVTQRMLTRQLRDLEAAGLVIRTVYPEAPPRVEYSLTVLGRSLEPVIRVIHNWGDAHLLREENGRIDESRRTTN